MTRQCDAPDCASDARWETILGLGACHWHYAVGWPGLTRAARKALADRPQPLTDAGEIDRD